MILTRLAWLREKGSRCSSAATRAAGGTDGVRALPGRNSELEDPVPEDEASWLADIDDDHAREVGADEHPEPDDWVSEPPVELETEAED